MSLFFYVLFIFFGMALIWGIFMAININYETYVSINRDDGVTYKATFEDFKREYLKTQWEDRHTTYKFEKGIPSRFNYEEDSQLHAGIMKFRGRNMLLSKRDWKKALNMIKERDCGIKEWNEEI